MKELSIEEKAKRYDEAIRKAKDMLNYKEVRQEDMEYLFPELKESEDEKIRGAILHFISHIPTVPKGLISKEDMIGWLEKQGEHANFRDKIQIGDKVTRNRDGVLVNLSQLNRVAKKDEKQGEQKPVWSEGDETTKNNISHIIRQYDKISKRENKPCWYIGDCLLWMQNIKDRVQPQPKSEWSEEDNELLDEVDYILTCIRNMVYNKELESENISKLPKDYDILIDRLKSLRPQNRWKPSDEQIEALKEAVDEHFDIDGGALWHLYEDLKKLKD